MANASSYNEFAYRTAAFKAGHPDRLATIATLFGMTPTPVTRCRVLEIGCGDGSHVIPMAFFLPESRFTAIDIAERPIAAGKELAAHLGLKNLTLLVKDILSVTPDFGEFDYIIAHGVYAWVSPLVQDKLLSICRSNLAPNGVAFVSYNAYPGSRLTEIARDMFQHFVRPLNTSSSARTRVRQLLEFAKRSRPQAGNWGPIMGHLSEFLDSKPDAVLAHDEMGKEYRPAYFHEFIEHAGRHGLQYLGEAEYADMNDRWLTREEIEPLANLDGDPLVLREQYMDFLKCRTFRNTLLCRSEATIHRDTLSESALKLLVASRLRPVMYNTEPYTMKPEEFRTTDGLSLTISNPATKHLLLRLAEEWPRRVPVSNLVSKDLPAKETGDFLVDLFGMGVVDLQSHWLPYVAQPGQRPESSPLVRLQLVRQSRVTSREHSDVEIQDDIGKELLMRADGSRDRGELLAALRRLDPRVTLESVGSNLLALAQLALLTA